MRKNVMPLLFKIFDFQALQDHRTEIFEIFDQSYNNDDARPGRTPYATKRCLEKVFENDRVNAYKFTKDNTIMIDSEVIKILDYPENSITIKPYEVSDVLNATGGHEEIFLEVATYIDDLVNSVDSVPDFIKGNRVSEITIFDHPEYVRHLQNMEASPAVVNPEVGASAIEALATQLE